MKNGKHDCSRCARAASSWLPRLKDKVKRAADWVRRKANPRARQAFGYLQVEVDCPDEVLRQTEYDLRNFAAEHSLELTELFFEDTAGSYQAFDTMMSKLRRQHTHHVVVPSMRHLARNRLLQNMMLYRLERIADAKVLPLSG